jgi:hypothetical protein
VSLPSSGEVVRGYRRLETILKLSHEKFLSAGVIPDGRTGTCTYLYELIGAPEPFRDGVKVVKEVSDIVAFEYACLTHLQNGQSRQYDHVFAFNHEAVPYAQDGLRDLILISGISSSSIGLELTSIGKQLVNKLNIQPNVTADKSRPRSSK